jgi:hypothetical protein
MTKNEAVKEIKDSILRQLSWWGVQRFWPDIFDIETVLQEGGEKFETIINDGLHDGCVDGLAEEYGTDIEEPTRLALEEYKGPVGESGLSMFCDLAEKHDKKAKANIQVNPKSN